MLKIGIMFIIVIIIIIIINKYTENKLVLELNDTNYDYIYEKYDIKNIDNSYYPSSYIFEIFTKNKYNKIYNQTIKIQKHFGINKTVYGIKKINNEYVFEYYYYYENENKLNNVDNCFKLFNIDNEINFENYYLASFELNENRPTNINEINIYYTANNCNHKNLADFHKKFLICRECLTCMNKTYNIKNDSIISKNIYKFFFREDSTLTEIYDYTKKLIGKNVDLNIIFTSYLLTCKKSICITKKPETIGFYFSLIPFDDFIIFLEKTNFNNELRHNLLCKKNKLDYLLFDIGFDIKINDDNSIIFTKLSFYGIL